MTQIYHNPRCSKSRATLGLIEEQGISPQIINYLDTPPDADTIRDIVNALGCQVSDIMRHGEAVFSELGLADPTLSEQQLIDAIVANPILLQRPIVIRDGKAAVGRPPESVLAIL